jgi:hypothetical protein
VGLAVLVAVAVFLADTLSRQADQSPSLSPDPSPNARSDPLAHDQDQALKAIRSQLAEGRTVTLIGDKGEPPWKRWILEEAGVNRPREANGGFSFHSYKFGMLELLPDPPTSGYRFSAEVRHDGSESGYVGIYFGHSQQDLTDGRHHWFCTVRFADKGRNAVMLKDEENQPCSLVRLVLYHHGEAEPAYHTDSTEVKKTFRPDSLTGKKSWRQLAVEVTPATFRAYWGPDCFGELPRAELLQRARNLCLSPPNLKLPQRKLQLPPEVCVPRHGLGLFVQGGSASFRRVRVQPLNPTD